MLVKRKSAIVFFWKIIIIIIISPLQSTAEYRSLQLLAISPSTGTQLLPAILRKSSLTLDENK
jgi:hypothetical protein